MIIVQSHSLDPSTPSSALQTTMLLLSNVRSLPLRRFGYLFAIAYVLQCLPLTKIVAQERSGSVANSALAISDQELIRRWFNIFEQELLAHAKRGTNMEFRDTAQAMAFLSSLSPAEFRPDPAAFEQLVVAVGGPEQFAKRFASAMQTHASVRELRAAEIPKHLEPVMRDIQANIQRQLPLQWETNPIDTLAKARADNRPVVAVFCARWAASCPNLVKSLKSGEVDRLLNESFAAVLVDITDNNSPVVQKYRSLYGVTSAPVTLVFDKNGNEVSRLLAVPNIGDMLSALRRAAGPNTAK